MFTTPTIQVFVDQGGYYGQVSGAFSSSTSELTFGTDFVLKIDQPEDGTSRCGILIRLKGSWEKRATRQPGLLTSYYGPSYGSIKVVYTAGYTINNLPAQIRSACNLLVSRMRYLWPLGMMLGSESYEERHLSYIDKSKDYLLGPVKSQLFSFRNWNF